MDTQTVLITAEGNESVILNQWYHKLGDEYTQSCS